MPANGGILGPLAFVVVAMRAHAACNLLTVRVWADVVGFLDRFFHVAHIFLNFSHEDMQDVLAPFISDFVGSGRYKLC